MMKKRTRGERDNGVGYEEHDGEEDVPEIVRRRRKNMDRNAAIMAALNVGQLQSKFPPPVKREKPRLRHVSSCKGGKSPGSSTLRRSGRLKGGEAGSADDPLCALHGTWVTALTHGPKRKSGDQPVKESWGPELSAPEAAERKKVLEEHINARGDGTAGTASYQHCLHRVNTMSDDALLRRVKAIERARGKKAKEKMLVFSHVLRGKGKDELCAMAEAALDRLVRGVPMPSEYATPVYSNAGTAGSVSKDGAIAMAELYPVNSRVPGSTAALACDAGANENDKHEEIPQIVNSNITTCDDTTATVDDARPVEGYGEATNND